MNEATPETDLRLRHRDLLAELGTEALRSRELEPLLGEASRIVAEGMGTHFAKVLEYQPAENNLLVRAGVGWRPGVVGHATLGADDGSPAGYALKTSEPVIANDLATEQRFRTPSLLAEHGIRRAINVIIRGDDTPYGVLEADSPRPGAFLSEDIAFLQAAANLLGVAIERRRREAELEQSLQARELLLREADHRIKNSLQMVVSLLSMQRSRLPDNEAAAAIDDAIGRVRAVAEAHRALHQSRDLKTISFDQMLRDLCRHTGQLSPTTAIACNAEADLEIDAERAIPLGLVVTELLTNAIRHAYPDGVAGTIEVRAERTPGHLEVSVTDRGGGIDPGAAPARTLGTSIVQALSRQIGLETRTVSAPGQGTAVTLRLPTKE